MQFPAGRKLHFFFKPCHPKTSPPSTVVIQGSLCSCSGYATSCDSFCSWVMCEGQFNRWGTLQPLKKHTSLVGPFTARGEWPFAKEWAVATSSLFAQVIGIISIKRACWVEWHSVISYPAVKINDNVHSAWLSPHCIQEACPDKADIILFFFFFQWMTILRLSEHLTRAINFAGKAWSTCQRFCHPRFTGTVNAWLSQ